MRILAFCLLSALISAPANAADAERELIFLILLDAVRADAVSSYGYDKPTTPVLDRLAENGVRYTRMYVNAPWTRPSTASFFSGLKLLGMVPRRPRPNSLRVCVRWPVVWS